MILDGQARDKKLLPDSDGVIRAMYRDVPAPWEAGYRGVQAIARQSSPSS